MPDIVEIRCPAGPQRLFTKLRLGQLAHRYNIEDNTIEFSCSDCARLLRNRGKGNCQVLHRYNFAGQLVETLVEARGSVISPTD